MTEYALIYDYYHDRTPGRKRPFYYTDSIMDARKVAVKKLIKENKRDQNVYILKNGKESFRISMTLFDEAYIRPSIGLKRGYVFIEYDYRYLGTSKGVKGLDQNGNIVKKVNMF